MARQYLITKGQIDKFARALSGCESREAGDPQLRKLEANALRSQLEELATTNWSKWWRRPLTSDLQPRPLANPKSAI